jgi:hypothetical protein
MKAIAVAKVLLLIEFSPFISCGAGKENLEPVGLSSRGPQTDYSAITVPPALRAQGADSRGVASRRETPIALRE